MDKLYIDTDIILDLIQKRQPHFQFAIDLFTLIEENEIEGYVSPLIFSNLFYILRKGESRKFAIEVLTKLKSLIAVLTIDNKIIDMALSSAFKDFEDAIQYYTAFEADLDYLITRNKSDYRESGLIICTAKEYLAQRAATSSIS